MFPKLRLYSVYLVLILGLLLAACSRTVIARNSSPVAAPESAGADDVVSDLMEALAAAGAQVAKGGEVDQPFFSTVGQLVTVNGSEVQLFVYADAANAKDEAGQVSPEGSAVGTSIMMWMATPHFYRTDNVIALYLGDDAATLAALNTVFGPQFAGGQVADGGSDDIGSAALAGLQQIGWDINGFSAETVAVDGNYARVTITSASPPGGFSAFMMRQDGQWTLAAHGSAFNPDELEAMGFPGSVLP